MKAPFTSHKHHDHAPRHLRKLHDRIVCAAREGDWAKAERLFNSAPAQYRAVTALLVFAKRLWAGPAASKRAKPTETAPSAALAAETRWKCCSACRRYIPLGTDVAAEPQPERVGEVLTIGCYCRDCQAMVSRLLRDGYSVEYGVVYDRDGLEWGTLETLSKARLSRAVP